MALHTDQGHPHVHVVVRAKSDQGERLNIRKATLREWRRDFARYLRDVGIEADATERAVRGELTPRKRDGIYRAMLRGESTHYHERAAVAQGARSASKADPGRDRLRGGIDEPPGPDAHPMRRSVAIRGNVLHDGASRCRLRQAPLAA
jgi:hypothetical protein